LKLIYFLQPYYFFFQPPSSISPHCLTLRYTVYAKKTDAAYGTFTRKAFLKKVRMSYSPSRYQRTTPKLTFIGLAVLVLFAAFLCAIAASALAAGVVSVAPGTAASLAGSILCPAHTRSTRLVTLGGGYSTPNTDLDVVKCYDAHGVELAGNGDSFTSLWWGAWMGAAALVGAGLSSIPDTKGQNAREKTRKSENESALESLDEDGEHWKLEKAELDLNKQKKQGA
jgi:hypothetical protein